MSPFDGDEFEALLGQLHSAHLLEVQTLREQVRSLQRTLVLQWHASPFFFKVPVWISEPPKEGHAYCNMATGATTRGATARKWKSSATSRTGSASRGAGSASRAARTSRVVVSCKASFVGFFYYVARIHAVFSRFGLVWREK